MPKKTVKSDSKIEKVVKKPAAKSVKKSVSKKSSKTSDTEGLKNLPVEKVVPPEQELPDNFIPASFSPMGMQNMGMMNPSLIFPEPPKNDDGPFKVTFNEQNQYYNILNQVIDPEVAIGIADMGIIYEAKEKDGILSIVMTLTSMGCPAGPQITTDIDEIMRKQPGIEDVEIEVVWDPPWSPERIKPELRMMLFGY